MKIFWSWQSDTPGKTGRHFIREALETAIGQLQQELSVEEPSRDLARELHLDHDRKNVPGSPDLASTIFEKIEECSVFVADVTPVGTTEHNKKIINPNVAIELGYALAHAGSEGLLMVLNEHYGRREDLPFDLRHKAGPIIYNLEPGTKATEATKKQLTGKLKRALRDCCQVPAIEAEAHSEIPPKNYSSIYFDVGEKLTERLEPGSHGPGPYLYLRIIPESKVNPLQNRDLKDVVYGIKIEPLSHYKPSASWSMNHYGGMTYSTPSYIAPGQISSTSQIFPNREIWGVNSFLLSRMSSIPIKTVEKTLQNSLRHYLEVARQKLSLECPLLAEAGASPVEGFSIGMQNSVGDDTFGPIHQEEIRSRHTLNSFDQQEVDKVLLRIFEDFSDAAAEPRPKDFRGFPGDGEPKD